MRGKGSRGWATHDRPAAATDEGLKALHRLHASPASGLGGVSFDLEEYRWRCDGGGKGERTRATARRLVVCWNVLEGWPTVELEDGCLREVDGAAREVIESYEMLDGPVSGEEERARLKKSVERLKAAFAKRDMKQDLTHGRPHDCEGCLDKDKKQDTSDEDFELSAEDGHG